MVVASAKQKDELQKNKKQNQELKATVHDKDAKTVSKNPTRTKSQDQLSHTKAAKAQASRRAYESLESDTEMGPPESSRARNDDVEMSPPRSSPPWPDVDIKSEG